MAPAPTVADERSFSRAVARRTAADAPQPSRNQQYAARDCSSNAACTRPIWSSASAGVGLAGAAAQVTAAGASLRRRPRSSNHPPVGVGALAGAVELQLVRVCVELPVRSARV